MSGKGFDTRKLMTGKMANYLSQLMAHLYGLPP